MSVRRQARRVAATVTDDGAPVDLADPDAVVWHDAEAYLGYMHAHGWEDSLPPQERMGVASHPENRRAAASEAWAVHNGVTPPGAPSAADWHRLREMGLVSE